MQIGSTIPSFSAPASTGMTLSSDAFVGKTPMVLAFFAGSGEVDDQSIDLFSGMDDRLAEFGRMRVQLLGIAKVTAADSRAMAEAHGWNAPVLADASGAIRRDFGIDSTTPAVIVTDADGTLLHVDRDTDDSDRATSVLNLLNDMKNDGRLAETARK